MVAVTFLAPLVVLPALFDFANLPQSVFLQVATATLLAVAVAYPVWRRSGSALERPPLLLPLAAFLAWGGLSCAWAPNPALSLRLWTHWVAAGLAFVLLVQIADRSSDLRPVLRAAFAAGVVVAVLGIGQRLFDWRFIPQAFPPAATFANKNMAAQFVVAVLPFGLALAVDGARRRLHVFAAVAGAGLLLTFVAVSRTRSAAVAVAVQAVLLVVLWRRPRMRSAAWAIAAAVAVAVAVGVQHARTSPAATSQPTEPSASVTSVQGRLAIWRNTLVMIREHPAIGVGLGGHAATYPLYARRAAVDPLFSPRRHLDFAHQDYLQIAAELGVVGIVLLGVLGFAFVRLVRSAYKRVETDDEAALTHAAVLGAAGLLVEGLFSFPAYRALPPWLLAIDAAVLAAAARAGEASRGFLVPGATARRIATLAATAGAVGVLAVEARWLRADRQVAAMRRAEARRDWPTVHRRAAAALALDRARPDVWFSLGTASLATGQPGDAARELAESIRRAPNDLNALANLGYARARTGDTAGALAALQMAFHIAPGEAELGYQIGRLLEGAGDAAGAREAYRQAARARPEDPRPHYQRGLLALQSRDFVEAEEALRATLGIDPTLAGAHKALGVALMETPERRAEAILHLKEALRLDPALRDRPQMEKIIADASSPAAAPARRP